MLLSRLHDCLCTRTLCRLVLTGTCHRCCHRLCRRSCGHWSRFCCCLLSARGRVELCELLLHFGEGRPHRRLCQPTARHNVRQGLRAGFGCFEPCTRRQDLLVYVLRRNVAVGQLAEGLDFPQAHTRAPHIRRLGKHRRARNLGSLQQLTAARRGGLANKTQHEERSGPEPSTADVSLSLSLFVLSLSRSLSFSLSLIDSVYCHKAAATLLA